MRRDGDRFYWTILLLVIVLAALVRVHLISTPLERDEGEYAWAGKLILEGIPPYAAAYNMKFPGTYAVYAIILKILGETTAAIRAGLIIVNAATGVIVFCLGRRLFDARAGALAAAGFLVASLGASVHGVFANAEHFVIFFATGGMLLLIKAAEGGKNWLLFVSGVLLGASFLMKQHGVFFAAFSLLFLLVSLGRKPGLRLSGPLIFSAGAILPFGAACLILYVAGVFDRFWFWTFTYASEYVSSVPLPRAAFNLKYSASAIISSSPLLWALAGAGLFSFIWEKRARGNCLFALFFFLFSFGAVSTGLYFREHYFVMLLPSASLLFGMGINSIWKVLSPVRLRFLRDGVPILLAIASLAYPLYIERDVLFFSDPEAVSRKVYGLNPFPESVEIARFIRENSAPGDRIAVLGSEPQVYFYSQRTPATGYIYTYPLVENHPYALDMQKEMISQIEAAKPLFIVYSNVITSWAPKRGAERLIFDWFDGYAERHYEKAGVVEIVSEDFTAYRWGPDSLSYTPATGNWLSVYKRKDNP